MPAKSEKQRRLFAIAEHHPSKLYKRNRKILKVPKSVMHEFAEKAEHTKKRIKKKK